jgi:DNA-binding IclR family transcriptional regulator
MNTINTISVREDSFTHAIIKLELLNLEEGRPIMEYFTKHLNASMVEIILDTGLDPTVVQKYLEELFHNGFIRKEQSSSDIRYTLNQSYLGKVSAIASTLAGFWK